MLLSLSWGAGLSTRGLIHATVGRRTACAPAFASVGLIIGVWSWNEFIFAITFLPTQSLQTVAVRYATFTGQWVTNYSYISSAGVIMILPAVLLFLLLQRRFVEGMTAGGLKM